MSVIDRNHVRTHGEGGPALMLAHGFGTSQQVWRHLVPGFARTHRVVCFDHVGAGRSDLTAYDRRRYPGLTGYARDLLEILDALELREAALVGHSVSAMIGLLAALERPERFSRLVMLCPSPRYLNDPPSYVGGFERADVDEMLALMDQNFIGWATTFAMVAAREPGLAEELSASFRSTDPRIAREFAEATFFVDLRDELPRLATPTLVVQCADDDIAPVEVGRYVAARVQRGTYAELPITGHIPQISHPRETEAVIRDYLDSPLPP